MKKALLSALALTLLVAGLALGAEPGTAADHLEAPLVQQDGRTDINDVYVFESPENTDNTVLIMTVNPVAGVLSPTTLDSRATYRIQVDNDGDARRDESIRARFGEVMEDGTQDVFIDGTVARAGGVTGAEFDIGDGGRGFVGTFDDPFFFDFQAFQDQVKGAGGSRSFCDATPTDFFAGFNTTAIVIEIPTADLVAADANIAVWGETSGRGGRIDRMGRPAIATVLINDGDEDSFNRVRPDADLRIFGDQVKQNLLTLSGLDGTGYTDAEARSVTEVLLPDVLTYDTEAPAGYLNGRALADDVIDASLTIVTGGLGANGTPVLTGDCVDVNDVTFPGTFPYLAPAH